MFTRALDRIQSFPKYLLEHTCLRRQSIEILKPGRIPRHIGFIMDGNRRFAKEKGLPTKEGHRAGAKALMTALESCYEIGIQEVSIYAFSIENFKRPKDEVDDLLGLLKHSLKNISNKSMIQRHNVHIRIIGNKSLIEPSILEDLEEIEKDSNTAKVIRYLNVCFAYTSRDEIARSIREVADKRESNSLTKNEISERVIMENFYAGGTSSPLDILVRTSGHTRLSDFLLWQCSSNCKIVFSDTLWPSFRFWELYFVLLKWSFEQSMVHNRHLEWRFTDKRIQNVDLRQLPASPPFASVSQKDTVAAAA